MPDPRSAPGPAQVDDTTLTLTPALRDSAKAVVSAVAAIDWQVTHQNHGKIYLNFPDAPTCNLAEKVIQEIGFGNADIFDSLLVELRTRGKRLAKLQAYITALVQGSPLAKPREESGLSGESITRTRSTSQAELLNQTSSELQNCTTEFDGALEQLQKQHSSSGRLAILNNLNELLGRAEAIRSQAAMMANSVRPATPGTAFPQPPAPFSNNPVQITRRGGTGCHQWQILPIELALADEVVGLCRNIEFSSLQTDEIKVSTDQMAQVRNYSRLLLDCGFARFDVSEDDNPHTSGALQQGLNKLLVALREFLKCLKAPISPAETDNMQKPLDAARKVDILAGKSDAASKIESGLATTSHLIKINAEFKVTVDGEYYQKGRNRRTLLGFAYFANGKETFDVNTLKFLALIGGPDRRRSQRWNERTNALKQDKNGKAKGRKFHFFKAVMKAPQEYSITGLRFIHELSQEQIGKYFVDNPPQTRVRRKQKAGLL